MKTKNGIKRWGMPLTVAVVALAVASAACSSGTSSGDKTKTAVAGARPAATAAATTSAGGSTPVATTAAGGSTPAAARTASGSSSSMVNINATAADFKFTLDKDSVAKSDTVNVTFKNSGPSTHTLNFYADDAFTKPIVPGNSGSTQSGNQAAFVFVVPADAGSDVYYRCEIHPATMKGELSVK